MKRQKNRTSVTSSFVYPWGGELAYVHPSKENFLTVAKDICNLDTRMDHEHAVPDYGPTWVVFYWLALRWRQTEFCCKVLYILRSVQKFTKVRSNVLGNGGSERERLGLLIFTYWNRQTFFFRCHRATFWEAYENQQSYGNTTVKTCLKDDIWMETKTVTLIFLKGRIW